MKQPEKQLHIFVALLSLWLASCSSEHSSSTNTVIDSAKVIEAGIEFIYKNDNFAPDGYMIPIKIISSPNVPKGISFLMNGKKCEVVPRPSRDEYFRDLQHPVPYFDITKLKLTKGDTIELTIVLPSVNIEHGFKIKKNMEEKMNVTLTETLQY